MKKAIKEQALQLGLLPQVEISKAEYESLPEDERSSGSSVGNFDGEATTFKYYKRDSDAFTNEELQLLIQMKSCKYLRFIYGVTMASLICAIVGGIVMIASFSSLL